MIIKSPACLTVTDLFRRKRTHIPEIVIRQKQDYVIQSIPGAKTFHTVTAIVKTFYLFIKSEHLRHVVAAFFPDDLFLIGYDTTQKLHIFLDRRVWPEHHRIAFPAHTDRDHVLKFPIPLHAIFPITVQSFAVRVVIPVFPVSYIVFVRFHLIPLLTGAHERLMVGLPDRDAEIGCQLDDHQRIF